jgi:small-conductance mechanosensitive channel
MKPLHQPLSRDELLLLWQHLQRQEALLEWVVLIACLGLAWLASRLLRGTETRRGSIWFGEHIVDGVLFPLTTLCLALLGQQWFLRDVPEAVYRLAVPMLCAWSLVAAGVKVLGAVFPRSMGLRRVQRSLVVLACVGTVLWITGVLPMVMDELGEITFSVGANTISVRNLIEGSISTVVVLIVVLWLSAGIEQRLLRGATFETLSLRKIAANATRALLLVVGLLVSLSAAGVDLTTVSVLGGAIGVGLGFGLQKLAANYVSGFVILAERSLRIGDLVKVDGFEGHITDINTRYTVVRSASGRESIVPNELLITQRVENASLADPNLMLTTVVQVDYGTDIEALRPALVAAVAQVPRVLAQPQPAVFLTHFAADGLELTVSFWIADPDKGQMSVRSDVNLAVLGVLNARGIAIPYPQRVIRVNNDTGATPSDKYVSDTPTNKN